MTNEDQVDPLTALRRAQQKLAVAPWVDLWRDGGQAQSLAYSDGVHEGRTVAGRELADVVTAVEALVTELRGKLAAYEQAASDPDPHAPQVLELPGGGWTWTQKEDGLLEVRTRTGTVVGRIAAGGLPFELGGSPDALTQAAWLVERVNGDPETHPDDVLATSPWPGVREVDRWFGTPGRWSTRRYRVYGFPDGSHALVSWSHPNTENQDTGLEAAAHLVAPAPDMRPPWQHATGDPGAGT